MSASLPLRSAPTTRQREPWEDWPQLCRNFNAAVDDADEICSHFCSDIQCASCTPKEALYISTYSASGKLLSDGKVDTAGLRLHLKGVGALGDRGGDGDVCQYRLYFAANDTSETCMRTPYMRQLLWHYHTPADVALAYVSERVGLGFQVYAEVIDLGDGSQPNRILHCWLKCAANFTKGDLQANVQFFSERMRKNQISKSERCHTAIQDPALYMSYDYTSGHCALLSTEHGTLFSALRQACQNAEQMRVNEDPFAFLVVYLARHLNALRRTAVAWRAHIYKLSDRLMPAATDRTACRALLQMFTENRLAYRRMTDAVQGLIQDIDGISKAHLDFCETRKAAGFGDVSLEARQWVEESLERQKTAAYQLVMLFRECSETAQSFTEVILGYSQLRNSYATEALAVDAKHDTQTMKTITYVTLLFLPSTFVSTLFSMEIFDFSSDLQDGGHITITRHGWVFLAVALPLTFMTIALAYLWMRLKGNSSPMAPDDEENAKEKQAGSDFVVRRKGKDGTLQDIPLPDLPPKELARVMGVLNRRLVEGTDSTRNGLPAEDRIYAITRRAGPTGNEIAERIPLDTIIQGAPREQTAGLVSLLGKLVAMDAELDAVVRRNRSRWYRRILPARVWASAHPDSAAAMHNVATGDAKSAPFAAQAPPARGGLHFRAPSAAVQGQTAPAESETPIGASPNAAAPPPARARADGLHFGARGAV